MPRRLIYNNWASYDELSDSIPLDEALAMRQFDSLLHFRDRGVPFDTYIVDAFWFAQDGAYRTWRKPNWPNGPDGWLARCDWEGIEPGLWFTANTLCHIDLAPEWRDSADADGWGLCLFEGGFLEHFLETLHHWHWRGVRTFKFDFAAFGAAPPRLKGQLTASEIESRNVAAFRDGLARFRASCAGLTLLGYNGFESAPTMERTDRPLRQVVDPAWLNTFDAIYCGDPRPADVPTFPLWRSVDIYSDHMAREFEHSGIPLSRIENCGFMSGPTGTCCKRGKAAWKGMFALALARGGDVTVLHGDLDPFTDDDIRWMAAAYAALSAGDGVRTFGGTPGQIEPYGYVSEGKGGGLVTVVNPRMEASEVEIPTDVDRRIFSDAGYTPQIAARSVRLGPGQLAVFASPRSEAPDLALQEDVHIPAVLTRLPTTEKDRSDRKVRCTVHPDSPGTLRIVAEQFYESGERVRTWPSVDPDAKTMADILKLAVWQGSAELTLNRQHDRAVWSGLSWVCAEVEVAGGEAVVVEFVSVDTSVASVALSVYAVG